MYTCYRCSEKFDDEKSAVNHLKKNHNVKNKHSQIKCLKNYQACKKIFNSFDGLKKHHTKCVATVGQNEAVSS